MNYRRIQSLYNSLVVSAIKTNNVNKRLKLMRAATEILYSKNWSYKDDVIESLLQESTNSISQRNFFPINHKVFAFIDSLATDNRGLTQQYISAIINSGYQLIYITSVNIKSKSPSIYNFLILNSAIIVYINENNLLKKAQNIYDAICNHSVSNVFLHIEPDSVAEVLATYSLPTTICKYQINLTNHAYWCGYKYIDYSFEFNEYGYRLSRDYRGIPEEKLLYLPFYPILEDSCNPLPFPSIPSEKIIVLSGGSIYKIQDTENRFLKFVVEMLRANDNTVFVWVGGGDTSYISNYLDSHQMTNRYYMIGSRKDINNVFEKSDIYINTFPVGGGLMSQLAAIHLLPIISLSLGVSTGNAETTVCQIAHRNISSESISDALCRVNRLIDDKDYRCEESKKTKECMISKESFEESFHSMVQSKHSPINRIDFDSNITINKSMIIKSDTAMMRGILSILKFRLFYYDPILFIKYIFFVPKWVITKYSSKFSK